MRILYIEDNPRDAQLVQHYLAEVESIPLELVCADRLAAGLERLAAGDIDAVLLDLMLPDSRGLDTFARLQARTPGVPVVVLAGIDDEAFAVQALQQGAQDYLVKGHVDGHLLVRSLRYAIERHRLQGPLPGLTLDELTGLHGRRAFLALGEQQLKLAHRGTNGLLLFLADVDGLGRINEMRGRAEGNRALARVAEALRRTVRSSDLVGRWGGDEFAVLAVHAAEAGAPAITARIRDRVRAAGDATGAGYELSLTVGVAAFDPRKTFAMEELVGRAEQALAAQKQAGSGRGSPVS
jgi:two-component system cell cycle response regulator